MERIYSPVSGETFVPYNDDVTLVIQPDGTCCFDKQVGDDTSWSIDYPSETDANDAFVSDEIEWLD